MHHLGIRVDDVAKEVDSLTKQGIGVIQQGKVAGVNFAYLNTEEIGGVIFELLP